jgi:hypothetical protein
LEIIIPESRGRRLKQRKEKREYGMVLKGIVGKEGKEKF